MDALLVRLSVAKRTLGEGLRLGHRGDEIGRVMSVLLCDLAAETALKSVAHEFGHKIDKLSFPDLVDVVGVSVPSAARMRDLRTRVRNPAQHGAAIPRPVDVTEMTTTATECLRESFAACKQDYATLTLVPLIKNVTLRVLLEEASTLAVSNPRASTRVTSRAFLWLEHLIMFVSAAAHDIETWWSYDPRNGLDMEIATGDGRARSTRELLTVVAGAALGLDVPRRLHLLDLLRGGKDASAACDTATAWAAIDIVASDAYRVECALPMLKQLSPDDTTPSSELASSLPAFVRTR